MAGDRSGITLTVEECSEKDWHGIDLMSYQGTTVSFKLNDPFPDDRI